MAHSSFRDLKAWQSSMNLAAQIYRITKKFPSDEKFSLTIQLKRAAISVPSNIAEGQGRRTYGEFLQQLSVARGSLMEIETQLELAHLLNYLNKAECQSLVQNCNELARLINGLMGYLSKKREK